MTEVMLRLSTLSTLSDVRTKVGLNTVRRDLTIAVLNRVTVWEWSILLYTIITI